MGKYIYLLILSVFTLQGYSQITTTANGNANQLAQILAGNGVTVSNVVLTCPNGAAGTFTTSTCNLGMTQGVILTTGNVNTVAGPNINGSSGIDNSGGGDSDLDNLTSNITYNAAVLEFDMQVLSDSVEFRYAFGSDEYPEYVCSNFNDVFGFFISGPGITGSKNIALIPGTTIPVAINSVNPGMSGTYGTASTCTSLSYSSYYVDNTNGTCLEYDGFTRVLTAKAKNLQPCQTYHLKLAVADVGDGIYDSGVFLEANSLVSNAVDIEDATTNVPNVSNAMEGCMNGSVRFHLAQAVNYPTTVNYTIGGTAINGTDYQNLSTSITIPAGDTTALLHIYPVADGLVEGNETVVIYLSNACSAIPYDSAVLVIVDSLPFAIAPGDTLICPGGSVQLSAGLASTYSWSPAAGLNSTTIFNPIATPSSTTTYVCSVTIGLCTATDQITITVANSPFSVNAGNDTSSCTGGVLLSPVVTGSPVNGQAFQYAWSPATGLSSTTTLSTTASPITATDYIIAVTSGGCVARDTVHVALGSINIATNSTDVTCYGSNNGTATMGLITGTPPLNISWSNGAVSQNVLNLAPGVYTVSVTDATNCTATGSVNINSPAAINFGQAVITEPSCNGASNGSATLTAAGGVGNFTYQWSNGSNSSTATNLSSGNYTLLATDASGCDADTTIAVGQPPLLGLSTTASNETCSGTGNGSAKVTALSGTAPYSYSWSTGSTADSAVALTSGSYTVTVSDNNGCSAAASVIVAFNNSITFSQALVSDVKCHGASDGSMQVAVNGATGTVNYVWNTGGTGANVTGVSANTYKVTATDQAGCVADTTLIVHEPASLIVTTSHVDELCNGGSTASGTANVNGGTSPYTYAWSTGAATTTITGLTPQAYSVSVYDANLCSATSSFTVTEPAALSVLLGSTPTNCPYSSDGFIYAEILNGTSPYNYNLNFNNSVTQTNNDGLFNNLVVGSYTVSVTDVNNCTATSTVFVNPPYPDEFEITSDSTSCYGTNYNDGSILVTPISTINQPYYYSVDGQGNQLTGEFMNLSAGWHQLTMVNKNGCIIDTVAFVEEPAQGVALVSPGDTSIQLGQSVNLHAGIQAPYTQNDVLGYTWWANLTGLSCSDCANPVATPYLTETYTVNVMYGKNCVATTTVTVNIDGHPPVFIPNTFTPNGDGHNDLFLVFGQSIAKVHMTIFNRWGELVFESNDNFDGWDGTYRGQQQNNAVFTYVADITFLDGKLIQEKGSITLMR